MFFLTDQMVCQDIASTLLFLNSNKDHQKLNKNSFFNKHLLLSNQFIGINYHLMNISILLVLISAVFLFLGQFTLALIFFISAVLFFLIVFVFGRFFDHLYWENKNNTINNESDLNHTDNKLSQFLYEQYLKGVYWNDKRKNR